MNKKLNGGIIAPIVLGILAVIGILAFYNPNNTAKADKGFTAAPVTFDDISFELVGSEYNESESLHTFYFNVKNVGNNPVRLSSVFAIINGDKRFSAADTKYSDSELNPDMDGTIDVTFEMPNEALAEGSPKIVIDRGLIFKDRVEIALVK